jgi:hypothetical protein
MTRFGTLQVHIRTQEWALDRWDGEDPPGLSVTWGRKPKFSVNGSRSCAELAIVHHLRADGWDGVWVNAFRGELRTQWFPVPAARRLAEVGAPVWAVEIFDCLRAANGGTLSGFFDVFAWRDPGRAAFFEVKVGPDRIKPTQLRFVEIALRFRRLEDFMIVEVAGTSPRRTSAGQLGTTVGQASGRRPVAIGPRFGGRDLQPPLRRPVPAGPGHYASREQRPPRAARWTADDVIEAVASCGDDAAAIAWTVTGWAAGPHLRLASGTGPSYPSFTVEADSGRTGGSRWRGVLALHASPHGGPPALEVRVKTMCRTPLAMTWRDRPTGPTFGFRSIAGTCGWPSLFGSQPGREVPDDHCRPSTALATIQPAFTDAERLALAGFLTGYRGLTREAYGLDLRQFTT